MRHILLAISKAQFSDQGNVLIEIDSTYVYVTEMLKNLPEVSSLLLSSEIGIIVTSEFVQQRFCKRRNANLNTVGEIPKILNF